MRKHDCFCLLETMPASRDGSILYCGIVTSNKYRYRTVLDHRRNCSRKTGRNCDHFIPGRICRSFQKRRCQCHKCEQICRGTGIYQGTVTNTEIFCKCMFKFICIASCGQPEFKGTIHKIYHFFCIINSGRIRDTVTFLIWFLFCYGIFHNNFFVISRICSLACCSVISSNIIVSFCIFFFYIVQGNFFPIKRNRLF